MRGSYTDRSYTAQIEAITILKVAANPVIKYIDRPEYQPLMADVNKLHEPNHIGILPQEIKPRDQNVVLMHDPGLPSLWRLGKIIG